MKKIVIGVIIICLICSISCTVFAADKTIWEQATEWINLGKDNQPSNASTSTYNGFEELAGILTGLGIWVIIISGAIIGIRFMLTTPEKKAELKKALTIYAIGSFIILGALTIWKIVFSLLDIF